MGQRVAIAASVTRFATALPWIEALTAVGALSAPAIWAAGCRWSQESVRVSPTADVWGLSAIAIVVLGAPAVARVTGFAVTPVGVEPTVAISDAALWRPSGRCWSVSPPQVSEACRWRPRSAPRDQPVSSWPGP